MRDKAHGQNPYNNVVHFRLLSDKRMFYSSSSSWFHSVQCNPNYWEDGFWGLESLRSSEIAFTASTINLTSVWHIVLLGLPFTLRAVQTWGIHIQPRRVFSTLRHTFHSYGHEVKSLISMIPMKVSTETNKQNRFISRFIFTKTLSGLEFMM